MNLHVFNPEHDIALAKNALSFTAPHAARALRTDLGFMPMLWAEDGDLILVDDVETAVEGSRHLKRRAAEVVFVTLEDLRQEQDTYLQQLRICPWGWDAALKHQLISINAGFVPVVPSDDTLCSYRLMSNRRFAAEDILPKLCEMDNRYVGESIWCDSLEKIKQLAKHNRQSVLKAPWSSSGRGLRYVDDVLTGHVEGWCRNVIQQQGGVMVEPFCNKVLDFGMEFCAGEDGNVNYMGLSLFRTANGAYTGSILATETDKREMMAKYLSVERLDRLTTHLRSVLEQTVQGRYAGPLGIDLMVVANAGHAGFDIHPCVELNLRRTMGHVALALSPNEHESWALMHIDFDSHYRLRVNETGENLLNTSLV